MHELDVLIHSQVFRAAAVIVLAMILTAFVSRTLKRTLQSHIKDNAARYRASKLTSVAGYVVVLIVAITQIAGQLSGFTVALGAAGAGIAFALQEVIASFAGWLAVALGGFYAVGDRVQLGGIKGDVIDIGFLRTTIMECGSWVDGDLYNGRIVRVANSFVFKEPVFNYSGDFPFLWDEITVPIKYGCDYELTRALLEDVADEVVGEYTAGATAQWAKLVRAYRVEDARLAPLVTLVANDNWVQFTLRYVVDHRARRVTKDALFTRILKRAEQTGGKVAFASMTVQLVEWPSMTVQLDKDRREPPGI
jgi:small-conductance mechanosensitive channel